jgi:hypothetical protein
MKSVIASVALIACLSACTFQTKTDDAEEKAEPFHVLIPLTASDRALFDKNKPDPLLTDEKLKAAEENVAKSCSLKHTHTDPALDMVPFLAAILGPLVKAGIGLGLDALNTKLKAEIEKHSAKYGASLWEDPDTLAKVTCFRFVRGVSTDKEDKVFMDMIIGVRRDAKYESVLIQPLRVYFSNPAPKRKSSDGKYGFAVSFTAVEVSNEERKTLTEVTILKDKFEPEEDKAKPEYYVRHYPLKRDKLCNDPIQANKHELRCQPVVAGQYVSFPEFSIGPDPAIGISVKAVEIGTPDKYLATFQKIFESAKDDIGSGLADLANDKLGLGDD